MSASIDTNLPYDSSLGAYLLLAPTLVVIGLFLYYPTVQTLRFSFFRTFLFGQRSQFVGLQNFTTLLTSAAYQHSLAVTFLFAGAVVVASLSIGLFVALLLHEVSVAESAYLVAAIWPYALPTAVAGIVFLFLANPSVGVYTVAVESTLGVDVDWFTDGPQALAVVTVAAVWKQIGFNVIFLLAALSGVPESLEEACRLDGVGRLAKLRRVYLPLISPTLVFLVVMNTIFAFFGGFAFVDLMTQGGPSGATNLLIYKLFKDAFEYGNLGLASAQSVILFVIVAALTYVQLRVSDERAHYGA
ncbi:carbohydrate ABC transporter permease [Halobaculum gomorrense]|uniref:Carbohydrate ABC transporter membrane protein 1, CUT1 family n=1 Tax=Halobaculum gomorrense TaxID=43928 RepID=A0A1M5U466_9EURY|nr:sugar ABC transporter permease [Halobaculum gomorrense]SHH57738.1 carbohydrate ABC transporter membrane protein 1, CUT1 family [Halobaculum gomorrense]